jgi:hypothetical protein
MSAMVIAVSCYASGSSSVVIIDNFDHDLNQQWQVKEFSGQTRYTTVTESSGDVLQAESHAAASALVYEKRYSLHDYPLLSWRWKVSDVIATGDASHKDGDDYAARIYVVFPHWFFPMTRSINYIWANKLPVGTHIPSSYTSRSMMLAVESGRDNIGSWHVERRNVLEDYRRFFGEEPPMVGAIAIMTDTDNTKGSALSWYDDIRIESATESDPAKE